jgi:hypothetical protein
LIFEDTRTSPSQIPGFELNKAAIGMLRKRMTLDGTAIIVTVCLGYASFFTVHQ